MFEKIGKWLRGLWEFFNSPEALAILTGEEYTWLVGKEVMNRKIRYDVWRFANYNARHYAEFSGAQKLGTVSSFAELIIISDSNYGPLGYTRPGTQKTVSYENVMKSWGEKPWTEKAIGQIFSR